MVRLFFMLILSATFLATLPEMKAQDTLDPTAAGKMAEMMCRQLPNLTSLADAVKQVAEGTQGPEVDPVVWGMTFMTRWSAWDNTPCLAWWMR